MRISHIIKVLVALEVEAISNYYLCNTFFSDFGHSELHI